MSEKSPIFNENSHLSKNYIPCEYPDLKKETPFNMFVLVRFETIFYGKERKITVLAAEDFFKTYSKALNKDDNTINSRTLKTIIIQEIARLAKNANEFDDNTSSSVLKKMKESEEIVFVFGHGNAIDCDGTKKYCIIFTVNENCYHWPIENLLKRIHQENMDQDADLIFINCCNNAGTIDQTVLDNMRCDVSFYESINSRFEKANYIFINPQNERKQYYEYQN